MLRWVYERALGCAAKEVIIATDDQRIFDIASAFGARVILTSVAHLSGTDRIGEVADLCGWRDDEVVVNLQGDEPSMPVSLIEQVANLLLEHSSAAIATLATPVLTVEEYLNPNAVKVITDQEGRALYFSRAPIPWHRDHGESGQLRFEGARRHLGLYAYRVRALRQLGILPLASLENAEKLEQLRALFHGLEIRVAHAAQSPGPDVNTAEDLARAEQSLLYSAR